MLILLFDVGLEADLRAMLRGRAVVVARGGDRRRRAVALGWAVGAWLLPDSPTLTHVFVGATLCRDERRDHRARAQGPRRDAELARRQIILGAAVIDDVLGLMVLAVVGGVAPPPASAGSCRARHRRASSLAAVLFLGLAVVLGHFALCALSCASRPASGIPD